MFGMRLLLKQSLDFFVAMLLHLSENICVWRRPAKVSVVSQPAGGPPPSGWVGSFFEHLFNCAVVTGLRLSAHIPNHNAAGSHSVAFFVLIYSRFRQNNRGKTLQTRRFTHVCWRKPKLSPDLFLLSQVIIIWLIINILISVSFYMIQKTQVCAMKMLNMSRSYFLP